MQKLNREDLIRRVERLQAGDWESDEEMERLFAEIDSSVPCPFAEIQGYIFHSDNLSSEEIVDGMLAHRAIQL